MGMHIGLFEIVIVVFLILAMFSPDQLYGFAKSLGNTIHNMKKMQDEFNDEFVEPVKKPFEEIKKDLEL